MKAGKEGKKVFFGGGGDVLVGDGKVVMVLETKVEVN
jgi:hypothetical protein